MNPKRLILARKRRGLNKSTLARLLQVDLKTLWSYESGLSAPSPEKLSEIASRLKFPVRFFLDDDDLGVPDAGSVSFRSMKALSARTRDMALTQGALALHVNKWLQRRFELPTVAVPDLKYETDPEAAAVTLRQLWGLGELSIRNMIHLLESKGVRVFSLSVEAKQIDAFSMWQDGQPCVFLNTWKSSEHSRFDAAHELAHLVLHRHGAIRGREPETDANRFASAFLMPKAAVIANASRFATVESLIIAKKAWGVSIAALNYRLHTLGFTSEWHYTNLCKEIAKRGYRTFEPDEMPRESSLVLPQLLASLFQDSGLGRSKIAEDVGISLAEFEQLMFGLVITGVSGSRRGGRPPIDFHSSQRLVRVK